MRFNISEVDVFNCIINFRCFAMFYGDIHSMLKYYAENGFSEHERFS